MPILPIAAIILFAAGPVLAETDAREGKVVECQRRMDAAASRLVVTRDRVLARCLAKAMRCPAALERAVRADGDPCLAAVGGRCREQLAAGWRAEHALARAGRRCLAPGRSGIPSEAFLGEDGLAFADLAPFCPRVVLREGRPEDVLVCQRDALACTAARAVASTAPRAGELLARLGVAMEEDRACLTALSCGDGILDDDEECDDGPRNSDRDADACRTTCLEATCGDGVVDSDEECDDGNRADGDGCDADCLWEDGACGDGTLDPDEECDDGNRVGGDGCDSACLIEDDEEGACGNGTVEGDEECDDGAANSDRLADHCRTDCTEPRCGDGVVDPGYGEECEPPSTLPCTAECAWRFPLPPLPVVARESGARVAEADGLRDCQRALLRGGARAFAQTRRRVGACTMRVAACLLPESETWADRCLARADRRCAAAVASRDRLVADTVRAVSAACERALGSGQALGLLLDEAGLHFRDMAAACPFAEERSPVLEDLVSCAIGRAQCLGEAAVAQSIPRARELLDELGIDSDEAFPCVIDPADIAGE